MDKMKVSQKIAELRARNGLTAKELGDKIKKSETTILNYEAGKIDIPLSSLLGIAEVLEVEPAVLVGGEEDEFGAEITIRAYREEDRRTLISILGMNGYTTRQIKVAREGKEDVDKILQELMYNRIILMPKYLAMYVKTDTNEGGDNINKNSKVIRECNEYMKLKWGKYYTFDDKKNTVTIKVPR